MDWGMANRMAQLVQPDGRCMFLPIDHGYFQGPTRNLERPGDTIAPLLPYADALFAGQWQFVTGRCDYHRLSAIRFR